VTACPLPPSRSMFGVLLLDGDVHGYDYCIYFTFDMGKHSGGLCIF
jgi:hypothetical protein